MASGWKSLLRVGSVAAAGVVACVPGGLAWGQPAETLSPERTADIRLYDQHVTTLANPFFEGRAPGTRGNRLAAEYIAFNFRRLGLEPAFPSEIEAADGSTVITPKASYRQTLTQGSELRATRRSVGMTTDAGVTVAFTPFAQATVLEYSGSGTVSGPLVFVGYSIVEGADGYSSYGEGDDLTGKVALVLRFEPLNQDGHSRWTERSWTPAASLSRKLSAAERLGAVAVILVNPPGADDPRVGELMDIEAGTSGLEGLLNIPAVMLSAESADRMVRAGDFQGRSLAELGALADEGSGVIDMPGVRVDLDVRVERVPIETDNVGGVLAGRGSLADEYVIVGAHYDHLGYGEFGSRAVGGRGEVHPGADDNASGTAGVLLAAARLVHAYESLPETAQARSILFLAFTAEESGLNGSRYFVRHMPFESDAVFAMVNMDMIGRLRDGRLELEGLDTGDRMAEIVGPFVDAVDLTIETKKPTSNSDHASFRARKIPILNFHTGLHAEYHTPDDVAALINRRGAVRVVELVTDAVMALALDPGEMAFTRPGREVAQADDEQVSPDDAVPAVPALAASFGVAVGASEADKAEGDDPEEPGMLFTRVDADSPAELAGVRAGDRLIRWSGAEIKDAQDWYDAIGGNNPGDLVELYITRDGTQLRLHAILSGG
ncbi:MAG: M28 family peptidase [Planctomycetes bacterium]|nr:M28 family peptidase [Planctomycetota bacterium]